MCLTLEIWWYCVLQVHSNVKIHAYHKICSMLSQFPLVVIFNTILVWYCHPPPESAICELWPSWRLDLIPGGWQPLLRAPLTVRRTPQVLIITDPWLLVISGVWPWSILRSVHCTHHTADTAASRPEHLSHDSSWWPETGWLLTREASVHSSHHVAHCMFQGRSACHDTRQCLRFQVRSGLWWN